MGLTPAACVAGIVALMETVPGVGRVHPQRRLVRTEQDLKRHFWDAHEERFCGWQVASSPSSTTVTERHPGHHGKGVKGGGNATTTFQFQIEGYFGLDDAHDSETAWRDLTWAVASEFNAYGLLDIDGLTFQLPCDIEQFGFATLAGAPLVHYARLTIGFTGRTRP